MGRHRACHTCDVTVTQASLSPQGGRLAFFFVPPGQSHTAHLPFRTSLCSSEKASLPPKGGGLAFFICPGLSSFLRPAASPPFRGRAPGAPTGQWRPSGRSERSAQAMARVPRRHRVRGTLPCGPQDVGRGLPVLLPGDGAGRSLDGGVIVISSGKRHLRTLCQFSQTDSSRTVLVRVNGASNRDSWGERPKSSKGQSSSCGPNGGNPAGAKVKAPAKLVSSGELGPVL